MTGLPDAAWWNSVQFTSGQPGGGQGFTMSREEMHELFKLATGMQQLIREQFSLQRAMVDIEPPAADPASHVFVGQSTRDHRSGAAGVGDAYAVRLREQDEYLRRLVAKLSEALSLVEGVDDEAARSAQVYRRNI